MSKKALKKCRSKSRRLVLKCTLNGKVVSNKTVVKAGDVLVFSYDNRALKVEAFQGL